MKNFGEKSKNKNRDRKKLRIENHNEKSYEKLENKINQKFEYIWLTLDPTMIYIMVGSKVNGNINGIFKFLVYFFFQQGCWIIFFTLGYIGRTQLKSQFRGN